jgi:hypothetical protein
MCAALPEQLYAVKYAIQIKLLSQTDLRARTETRKCIRKTKLLKQMTSDLVFPAASFYLSARYNLT